MIAHVQTYFCHRSLGTQLEITVSLLKLLKNNHLRIYRVTLSAKIQMTLTYRLLVITNIIMIGGYVLEKTWIRQQKL